MLGMSNSNLHISIVSREETTWQSVLFDSLHTPCSLMLMIKEHMIERLNSCHNPQVI